MKAAAAIWAESCAAFLLSRRSGTIFSGMSTPDRSSRAAELAAQQVEAIVEAAQQAAHDMQAEAVRKLEEERARLEAEFASRKQKLEEQIEKLRADAEREAHAEREAAHAEAVRQAHDAEVEARKLREEARREAAERVAAAEKAADEALADARAMSGGLQRLGKTLEEYAERILRDVQAGHNRLRADLRVASGTADERRPAPRRAARPAEDRLPSGRARRSNPFDEIDVPDWVARDD